jgi:hypothetical protein
LESRTTSPRNPAPQEAGADGSVVAGRRIADRYRLVDQRRDGAWNAVDESLRRSVVVHLLSPRASAGDKERFTAEARSLAALNHRHVVATFDTGVDGDGSSYRVDELPSGDPLDFDAVDENRRVSYATQIAMAITDAHSHGLAHGALNSSCVLCGDAGRVKVVGIHRADPDDVARAQAADVASVVTLAAALAPSAKHPLHDLAAKWRREPPASAAVVLDTLEQLPEDSDGTAALTTVTRANVEVPPPPPARRRRRAILAVVLVAIAAVAAVVFLPSTRTADISGATRTLTLTATSFDPNGRPPTENEPLAKLAVDGDPSTAWATDRYHSAHFGNLKPGLGLVLRTSDGTPAEFHDVHITTTTPDWSFEIYVAAQPAGTLAGWGAPVARGSIGRDASLTIPDPKGAALLIWISDPKANRQLRINEVTVRGRA